MRPYLVAGNWKMNTDSKSGAALAGALVAGWGAGQAGVEMAVCPPFPYLTAISQGVKGSAISVGAQNCWHEVPGAFTGEIGTEMLADLGCKYVILGHSERRHILGETDELIAKKVHKALGSGLKVILCVGELLAEREGNQTEAVLDQQMSGSLKGVAPEAFKDIVIAYEPVWAIGTGKTATPDQAEGAHLYLRNWVSKRYNSQIAEKLQILYGGSVKPDNAAELMKQPNVDGALVGGASLKAEQFLPIAQAAAACFKG